MGSVRSPGHYDKVYKDECTFSFDTPESPGGLYINMNSFQAFGEKYVELDYSRTNNHLYLNEKHVKVPISQEEEESAKAAPTKMNIGGEGGFQLEKKLYNLEKQITLVIMPERTCIELPCSDLPEVVLQAINAVVAHEAAGKQEEVSVWEEERAVSKYAENLEQLPANGKVIPSDPSQWKCDESGATENLWLNLSTGFIGSGRQNWDGSGGNGAAIRHFDQTGKKYPLAVKLGTITPHSADVYSYAADEDDMVLDPHLAVHLSHWGIDIMQMEKTEKTMAELEIERNQSFEFDKITEAGAELVSVSGPGLVGLVNLGNSCYMNSVLQVMWSLPGLSERYLASRAALFETAPSDALGDFATQFAKVGAALVEAKVGTYQSNPPLPSGEVAEDPKPSAAPSRFKTLVGRGHPEFSSGRQQDACEYFQYLLSKMECAEHAGGSRLGPCPHVSSSVQLYQFATEDKVLCKESGFVSYKKNITNVLGLNIPLEDAVNRDELEAYKERELKRQKLAEEGADAYIGEETQAAATEKEDPVIPQVPFQACLAQLGRESIMEDYFSAALGKKVQASHSVRLATMPPLLVVQMRRYFVDTDWTPKKMNVLVEVPETLSLEAFRSAGPQPDDKLQPEVEEALPTGHASVSSSAAPQPNPEIVSQLMSMGFSENGSKRAALATGNSSAEASMEWVFGHMEDPDFNSPLPDPADVASANGASDALDAVAMSSLTAMGFTEEQAKAALKSSDGNVERAGDWLFSHMDNLDSEVAKVNSAASATANPTEPAPGVGVAALSDGQGEYSLVGIVSHMGSNTACGHYVCHIKKDGRWVLFNDEKVALSEKPPMDLGYMYFFKRNDV